MIMIYPRIPEIDDRPPTLYSLMDSIVNYGQEEQVKIRDLASNARTTIFDFDYPLSDKVNKEEFETLILNNYLTRRIGFDTFTVWQIELEVKLNTIMPTYNKLFDALDGWDLLKDGETIARTTIDSSSNTIETQNSGYSVNDARNSDTPQEEMQSVRDGKYVSNYDYTQNNSNTNSNSSATSSGNVSESIMKSPADKIRIYKEFIKARDSIYAMIFKDLDSLFYGLV